jgi:hypothetical protein
MLDKTFSTWIIQQGCELFKKNTTAALCPVHCIEQQMSSPWSKKNHKYEAATKFE